MTKNDQTNDQELVLKVKSGTKVRVVEAAANDEDLMTRDLHISAPQHLKISVKRVQEGNFKGSPSTITMCG